VDGGRVRQRPTKAGRLGSFQILYTMVKKQVEYDAALWAERDAEREKRFESKLKRQAQ